MRQAARRARTRNALLRAAASGFASGGYDGVSLDAIAALAGLSKGAVYAHFGTKLDLYLAVAGEVLAEADDRNRRVCAALAGGQPATLAAGAYFALANDETHASLVTGLWQMATHEARVRESLDDYRRRRLVEFSSAALGAGAVPALALEIGQTAAKLIDADTLYGWLESSNELRAG